MFSAILVCAACATLEPSEVVAGTRPEPEVRAAYEAARSHAGRDANAHVRLALWCEAQGREAERLKHLAIAVLADPSHATARGLLGLVADRGGWRSPEAVSDRLASDTAHAAALAAYNGRRARMGAAAFLFDSQHVPEKWKPVFRKGHATTKRARAVPIPLNRDGL